MIFIVSAVPETHFKSILKFREISSISVSQTTQSDSEPFCFELYKCLALSLFAGLHLWGAPPFILFDTCRVNLLYNSDTEEMTNLKKFPQIETP